MTTERYVEIDKACPACGMKGIWFCSSRDCPKGSTQKEARDAWLVASTNPPEEVTNE